MIPAQHDALRAGVLLEEISAESAPELPGELRSQLVGDESADVVFTKDVQGDGHGARNLRAALAPDKLFKRRTSATRPSPAAPRLRPARRSPACPWIPRPI